MKRENRLYGMVICLITLGVLFIIWNTTQSMMIKELTTVFAMFLAGYAFRDTLEPKETEEE